MGIRTKLGEDQAGNYGTRICADGWNSARKNQIPTYFSSERRELGSLEEFWKNRGCKLLFLVDDERTTVRQPRDGIAVFIIRQNFH